MTLVVIYLCIFCIKTFDVYLHFIQGRLNNDRKTDVPTLLVFPSC